MNKKNFIAFYGGTFDPIHYGHIRPIIDLARIMNIKNIIFLPNNIPLHRPKPIATAQQRLDMLRLALINEHFSDHFLTIDERELYKNVPSRTFDTLKQVYQEYRSKSSTLLGFIIGKDSLLTLPKWYRWFELLNICNILVCSRPGYALSLSKKNMSWIKNRLTNNPNDLHQKHSGLIYCASTPEINISGSEIRRRYRAGISCNNLLPTLVQNYIEKKNYIGNC